MSIFAIADLHLSLSVNKPMDIFNGWDNYVDKIKLNWEKLVKKDDSVVIAGDISWAMALEESLADFEFINNLPGTKYILKGNHDFWWESRTKMENFFKEHNFNTLHIIHNSAAACENIAICGTRGWFYDAENDNKVLLREANRLNTSIIEAEKIGLQPIVFLHYPPLFDTQVCEEIMNVLKQHDIKKCYYGHLHGNAIKKAVIGKHYGIDFRLISCDFIGFTPVVVV